MWPIFIRYGLVLLAAIPAGIGHYLLLSYGTPTLIAFLISVPVCVILGLGIPALIRMRRPHAAASEVTIVKNDSIASVNSPSLQPSTVAASIAVVFVAATAPGSRVTPLTPDTQSAEVYHCWKNNA